MIGKLLNGLFKLIISLISLLLSPIDSLINQFLPSLSNALNAFNTLVSHIIDWIGYCIDLSLLSSNAINFITMYLIFVISFKPTIYLIKLVIKWYNALKP